MKMKMREASVALRCGAVRYLHTSLPRSCRFSASPLFLFLFLPSFFFLILTKTY